MGGALPSRAELGPSAAESRSELRSSAAEAASVQTASFFGLPKRVYLLLSTLFVIGGVYTIGIELHGPFLRTLVTCPEQSGHAISAGAGIEFSGSALCGDTTHVLATAQRLEGRLVSSKLLVHGLAAPFWGAVADARGRKPVLLTGLLGFVIAFALLFLLAFFAVSSYPLLMGVFIIEGATNAFDVVYMAMLADMCPDARSSAFSAMFLCNAASFAAGQAVAVAVLRLQLVEYTFVWATLSVVVASNMLIVHLAVKETLSETPGALGTPDNSRNLRRALAAPLRLLFSDKFLQLWLAGEAIATLGGAGLKGILASFTISVYGWRAGYLQMYTALCKPVEVLSLLVPGLLAMRLRPSRCAVVGLVVDQTVAAWRVMSPFSQGFLISAAYADAAAKYLAPASTAFFSAQFAQDEQATVSAVRHLSSNLATAASHLLMSSPLVFSPSATGLQAARPFAMALIVGLAGCVIKLGAIRRNAAGGYSVLPVTDPGKTGRAPGPAPCVVGWGADGHELSAE